MGLMLPYHRGWLVSRPGQIEIVHGIWCDSINRASLMDGRVAMNWARSLIPWVVDRCLSLATVEAYSDVYVWKHGACLGLVGWNRSPHPKGGRSNKVTECSTSMRPSFTRIRWPESLALVNWSKKLFLSMMVQPNGELTGCRWCHLAWLCWGQ